MIRKLGSHIRNQWMGALALFLVLSGGTALAASGAIDGPLPGVDQVGSLDIIDKQVRSSDIGKDQVKGANVDESSLIGVNDNCPVGMTMYAQSFCLDAGPRGTPTNWSTAGDTCAANGLRLPTVGELKYAAHYGGIAADTGVWTDQVDDNSVESDGNYIANAIVEYNGGFALVSLTGPWSIYCAASTSDLF